MKKIIAAIFLFSVPCWSDINVTEGSGKTIQTSTIAGKEVQVIAIYESSNTVTPIVSGLPISTSNPMPVQSTGTVTINGTVTTTNGGGYSDILPSYIHKYEYTGSSLTYHGIAAPGSSTSSNVWRMIKYLYSGSNVSDVLFSSGTANFIYQWDLRTTYTYQ